MVLGVAWRQCQHGSRTHAVTAGGRDPDARVWTVLGTPQPRASEHLWTRMQDPEGLPGKETFELGLAGECGLLRRTGGARTCPRHSLRAAPGLPGAPSASVSGAACDMGRAEGRPGAEGHLPGAGLTALVGKWSLGAQGDPQDSDTHVHPSEPMFTRVNSAWGRTGSHVTPVPLLGLLRHLQACSRCCPWLQ